MACPMITPQKNELQKLHKLVPTSRVQPLLALLVCSLVFLPSSYSNAGGVNSNTILDGSSTTSTSSGNPTSVTVTNDDNSTTTTQTTPITTTTTTFGVTQTEVPNVVTNPTFTNELGGGSFTGWSISTCPGGCAFSPSNGFMAGNGGTITQSYTQDDLFPDAINSTEEAQGMTFSFGAEVDNNQVGAGNRADTWSIKLELFDSDDSSLGSTEIGSTVIFAPTIKTGALEIDSGNVVNTGVLTLFGNTALNGDFRFGPFFNDVFTTFTYNEIEETITSAITYDTLITQVTCEVLNTCILVDTSAADVALSVVSEVSQEVEVSAVAEVAEVAEIAALPTITATAETTMQVAAIEAPAEPSVAEAPVNEEVASAAQPDLSEPEPEPETTTTAEAEPEPAPASSTSNKPESKVSASDSRASNKPTSKASVAKKSTPKQKAAAKKKAMSKAGNKMVKKMGSKKYSSQNQVKTLVLMQVLGNTSTFFDPGKIVPDTPNFFTPTTLPDNIISDNNLAAYALIGGSDQVMDNLVNSQYGN
jgi:hypothetical protein